MVLLVSSQREEDSESVIGKYRVVDTWLLCTRRGIIP
jgi:hypothetical protein